jgi:hypothetical protein
MNHQEQQVAGVRESLTNAGIGPAYHYKTLQEVAPDLVDLVGGPIRDAAKDGRGMVLVGGVQAYDETILIARALHLQGVRSLVTHLSRLIRWSEFDGDEIARVGEAQALFVLKFTSPGECPFTRRECRIIEDLIEARIDNGQAFFAQVGCTLKGSGWWSDEFVERVSRATSLRECNESGAVASSRAH